MSDSCPENTFLIQDSVFPALYLNVSFRFKVPDPLCPEHVLRGDWSVAKAGISRALTCTGHCATLIIILPYICLIMLYIQYYHINKLDFYFTFYALVVYYVSYHHY